MSRDVIGLDFGTTNSVCAFRGESGGIEAARFSQDAAEHDVFRSVLNFWTEGRRGSQTQYVEAGPFAIARFLAEPEGSRFLQSIKTFAASPLFRSTIVHGKSYAFEDLLQTFLGRLTHHADARLHPLPRRILVGRPVTFAGISADPVLAQQRYDSAFAAAGFEEVHYVYEPVAAAFYFAQKLTADAHVLVADFGGGTSDFSVLHFEKVSVGVKAHALAQSGVGIAGDRFDYQIIDHAISPRLGKHARYRSFGKMLDMPAHYFANFARWNQFALLKSSQTLKELRQLAAASDDPGALETLIQLIEEDQGYPLYQAVSRAKMALTHQPEAVLEFRHHGIDLSVTIRRRDFESWIAPDLARIEAALDEALNKSGMRADEIDRVFLTGGSSFVPAVRALFERRFAPGRIESGDQLLSIAYGLALIGEQADMGAWTVREPEPVSA